MRVCSRGRSRARASERGRARAVGGARGHARAIGDARGRAREPARPTHPHLTTDQALSKNERVITNDHRRRHSTHRASHHHRAEGRHDLRTSLISAADRILRREGVAGLTTREIAREAGCSDGALYVHFADKSQLLAAVCERWLPDLVAATGDLVNRVGAGTVAGNLEAIAATALEAFAEMAPVSYAIGGNPELLASHRAAMRARGVGPKRSVGAVRAYLEAEQRVGRVRADAACEVAASMLIGSCWHRAAMRHYIGENVLDVDDATYASKLALTLGAALAIETARADEQPTGGRE